MKTITGITSVTVVGAEITIVGTLAVDTTFNQPSQRVTIGQFPVLNPVWSRALRLTDEALFVLRAGQNTVAMLTEAWAAIGYLLENGLTFPPLFTTQPVTDTTTFAKVTLTSNNTNVSNNDTVTIGNKTYTFKTALTPTEGEVLIGANADASLLNLIRAINHSGTPDTDYKCAAAHTQVSAATSVTAAHTFLITSKEVGTASNAYVSTETAATLSFGTATLVGGVAAATFTVVTASELSPVTFQWFESADGTTYGAALANGGIYAGATTATLTITPTDTTKNGYYYKCIATNGAGATTSSAVVLAVT